MKVIFTFNDGQKVLVGVHGEIKDYYLTLVGTSNSKIPDILDIAKIEERAERKHHRVHKYTGFPVSIESIAEKGEQIKDNMDWVGQTEFCIILEEALKELTDIQRFCFVEVCIKGRSQNDVAIDLKYERTSVSRIISKAKKKLKKFFEK